MKLSSQLQYNFCIAPHYLRDSLQMRRQMDGFSFVLLQHQHDQILQIPSIFYLKLHQSPKSTYYSDSEIEVFQIQKIYQFIGYQTYNLMQFGQDPSIQNRQPRSSSSSSGESEEGERSGGNDQAKGKKEDPWLTAPQQVKSLFTFNKRKMTLSEDYKKLFQKKPTNQNYCTNFFGYDREKMYQCNECCMDQSGCYMCFCQACWDPSLHIGHNYDQQFAYSDGAYCDCGRNARIKQQSMCSKHRNNTETIEVEIGGEEKRNFIETFGSIFKIFYLKCKKESVNDWDEHYEKIIDYLIELNEKSAYYNRLTAELFKVNLAEGNDKDDNIIYFIGDMDIKCRQIIAHMAGDLQTLVELGRILYNYDDEDGESTLPYNLKEHIVNQFDNPEAIQRLANEQKVSGPIMNTIDSLKNSQRVFMEAWIRCLNRKGQEIMKQQQVPLLKRQIKLLRFINDKAADTFSSKIQTFLKLIFDCFPTMQNLKAFVKAVKDVEQYSDEELEKDILTEALPDTIDKSISQAFSFIAIACNFQYQRIIRFREYMKQNGLPTPKLEAMLICAPIRGMHQTGQKKLPALTYWLLLQQSPLRKESIKKSWQHFIQPQIFDISQIVIALYSMISFLAHSSRIYLQAKAKLKVGNIEQAKKEDFFKIFSQQEQRTLEQYFKGLLFKKEVFSKSYLDNLRGKLLLEFPNSAKILNCLCSYNEEDEEFKYISREKYPHPALNFPFSDYSLDSDDVITNGFNYNSKFELEANFRSVMKQFFMNPQIYEDLLKKKYAENYEGCRNFGYTLFVILSVADKICNGQNLEVHTYLTEARADSDKGKLLYISTDKIITEKALLAGDEKEEDGEERKDVMMEGDEQEKNRLQELKKKGENKKKMFKDKFKKARIQILQKMSSRKQSLQDDDQDECLVCHEKKKKDNPLVYLAACKKSTPFSSAKHGGENKANISLTTCFHTMHTNCFAKFDKDNDLNFDCPLCTKKVNCILPRCIDEQDRNVKKMVFNGIIACMVTQYKNYETDDLFTLMMKHLVEAKGLKALTLSFSYENKAKQFEKNDEFIEKLLQETYVTATPESKQQYDEQFKLLLQEFKTCKKRVYFLLQTIIAKAIHCKINCDSLEDSELIEELNSCLCAEEFALFKEQLENLLGEEIVLKQSDQQLDPQQNESLSFNVQSPPAKTSQFSKYFVRECEGCKRGKTVKYLCLLCGKVTCEPCQQIWTHSKDEHNGVVIRVDLRNGQIFGSGNNYRGSSYIYQSDFKTLYYNKNDNPIDKFDEYYLNEIKFNKFMMEFLDNA